MLCSTSAPLQQALRSALVIASEALQNALLRHGGTSALVQEVLRGAHPVAAGRTCDMLARLPCQGPALTHLLEDWAGLQGGPAAALSADAAFQAVRDLRRAAAVLDALPVDACSRSVAADVSTSAQATLLPDKSLPHAGRWVYRYSVVLQNTGDAPLRVERKHWQVLELTGATRMRSSDGLLGERPVIPPGDSLHYQQALTIDTIQGGMQGAFELAPLSGPQRTLLARVAPFALSPTRQQYDDLAAVLSLAAPPAGVQVGAGAAEQRAGPPVGSSEQGDAVRAGAAAQPAPRRHPQ